MRALISRRFDGWVSAKCCLAAVAGPPRRWRPHPSNPLCAGGLTGLALDEREYKADRTSRDRPHCHRPAVNETDLKSGGIESRVDTASRFIEGNINALRALAPLPRAPVPRPSRPQPRTPPPRWSRRHSDRQRARWTHLGGESSRRRPRLPLHASTLRRAADARVPDLTSPRRPARRLPTRRGGTRPGPAFPGLSIACRGRG